MWSDRSEQMVGQKKERSRILVRRHSAPLVPVVLVPETLRLSKGQEFADQKLAPQA
ncbi:predicted protein [Pyrenophora tritici-repentis Pt-1C-BFP]|uniref:Uncharacterized protein n=1 Tax=Pyrenophora tritici-repentis (strain Pt-1C-BFP) TaxID=426418 RepID=B2W4R6_PYRTR|nr:uncharacterized protein PTRG_04616 [Pyrenophora tritici-repentis Pt-1C-BFP]EDU47523.1 predicted protein [Pyrenophora tritici-repentis Pt-1C-BFP]